MPNPHSDLPFWFEDSNPFLLTFIDGTGLWVLDVGPKVVRPGLSLPGFINPDGSFRDWLGLALPCVAGPTTFVAGWAWRTRQVTRRGQIESFDNRRDR